MEGVWRQAGGWQQGGAGGRWEVEGPGGGWEAAATAGGSWGVCVAWRQVGGGRGLEASCSPALCMTSPASWLPGTQHEHGFLLLTCGAAAEQEASADGLHPAGRPASRRAWK